MTRWEITLPVSVRREDISEEHPGEVGPFSGSLVFSVEALSAKGALALLSENLEAIIQDAENIYARASTYVGGKLC